MGVIQSSASEEEEKKEIDLTSKPLSKGMGTPKRHPSSLLSKLTSSSLSGLTIVNHIVHTLLLHDSLPLDEALRLIETSLQSDSISLTDIDRVSIEQQLLTMCSLKDSKLSLLPEKIASLAPTSFIWNEEEEEQIMKRISSTKGKQSTSSETVEKGNTAKETDEPKPKRTRKTRSKQIEESSLLKELTLTIPNHVLRSDGYLLTPDLVNSMNTNMGLFVDYKKRVENEDME